MKPKFKATFYVILVAILSLVCGCLFDIIWCSLGWIDTPFRFLPVVAMLDRLVQKSAKCIADVRCREYKEKLTKILSVLLVVGTIASILFYFILPQAFLTCEIFVVSLSFLHLTSIESQSATSFKSTGAVVISHCLLAIGVPLLAFCFTLGWSATLLPVEMLGYAYTMARFDEDPRIFYYCNLDLHSASKILLVFVVANLLGCAISFFFLSSLFITAFTGIAAILMSCIIKDFQCLIARYTSKYDSWRHPFILSDAASALGSAAIIGAARSASSTSYIWELAGAIIIVKSLRDLIIVICYFRKDDSYRPRPNPVTARVALQMAALLLVMMLLPISTVGSFLYSYHLPTTTSPMPLVSLTLLLLTLFILDNLRTHIPWSAFAVAFMTISIPIAAALVLLAFMLYEPIIETLITGLTITVCLAYYTYRMGSAKDESKKRYKAALAAALLQQQQQQHQQRMQQYFQGPIPPAA